MNQPARKRRSWLVVPAAIGVLLLLVALLLFAWRPGEPIHQGRRVSEWAQDLVGNDPVARTNAIIAIRQMNPEAREYYATMLRHGDSIIKKPYARIAPRLPGWIRRLMSGVFNPFRTGQQRYIAMEALAVLGTNAPPEALARALRDPERAVALRASQALADLGPAAIPHLIKALDDNNREVVSLACSTLARTGPWASNAIPRLIPRLGHSDTFIFNTASAALHRIGSPAFPALCNAVKDPDENIRRMAARTLGLIGGIAYSTAPCLVPLTRDPNPRVRLEAVDALGKVGPFTPDAVQAFLAALDDSSAQVRGRALEGLKRASHLAAPAVPRLTHMLATPDSALRIEVLKIIGNVGPAAGTDVRAAVVALTGDPDPMVSQEARTTVTRIDAPRGP